MRAEDGKLFLFVGSHQTINGLDQTLSKSHLSSPVTPARKIYIHKFRFTNNFTSYDHYF